MESFKALEVLRQAGTGRFEPGSDAETAAIDRFRSFFGEMKAADIEQRVAQTYAPDVFFNDTLKTVRGLQHLQHYLRDSAEASEAVRAEVVEVTRTGHGDYLLRWKMMIRFKRFAKGRDTWSIGMTHLRFDDAGRIAYQQDYWDAADALFQYVPVLGWGIRAIKRRL